MKNKKENSKSPVSSLDRDELNRRAQLIGIKYIDLRKAQMTTHCRKSM